MSLANRTCAFVAVCMALVCVPAAAGSIDRQIARMSDRQQIAQLMIVGFDGTRVSDDVRRLVGTWHAGGVALYAQNIESSAQVAELNREIDGLAGAIKPFIAVDQEGGLVQRLRGGSMPSAMAIGATRSPELARRAGREVGADLRALGFTMNFAPVLDVLSNPENTSLQTRAFGSDPHLVASLGIAFMNGERDAGIIPVAKHFPGEGGTAGDAHYELPVLRATRRTLEQRDLLPFRAAIAAGVPAIMTAHVAVPAVTGDDLPATISPQILTGLLRKEMQFRGLIITDELQMRAIRDRTGLDIGEIAVRAVLAGADMIMVVWNHEDRQRVFEALQNAYASGRLSRARVRASLRRILLLKQGPLPQPATPDTDIDGEIARRAITVIRHDSAPLLTTPEKMAFVGIDGPLRQAVGASLWVPRPPRVDSAIVDSSVAICKRARLVVVALGVSPNDRELAIEIRKRLPGVRLVLVDLASPFLIRGIHAPDAVVFAYDGSDLAQSAVARVLRDPRLATARLPVTP